MAAPGINLSLGPIGKTAVIVVGGVAAGALARQVLPDSAGLASGALMAAGVAYAVTGSLDAAVLVGAAHFVGVAVTSVASFAAADDQGKVVNPRLALGGLFAGVAVGIVGTYLVVR